MTRRPEFSRRTKLAAYERAGGPDNPRCECDRALEVQNGTVPGCSGQPITTSDPAEYHHIEEAESGCGVERWDYLRSVENCACVRRSCHRLITSKGTAPKIAKSRRQRAMQARAKTPKRKFRGWRRLDGSPVWND